MSRLLLSVALVLSVLSLAAAQSISFSQVASNSAFPPREYAACTQSPPSSSGSSTFFFFGGFSVTLNATASTTNNSYYDTYFNDAWSSSNSGQSWSQLTGSAAFPAQAWNGAVYTSSGTIVYIGGGGDSNAGENNNVWLSTDGVTFTATTAGPWDPRENAGIAGQLGTNNILVALGNTRNDESVDDIWLSTNAGSSWTQQCHYTSCPFVNTVSTPDTAGQVHGPAAAGLSNGAWLLIGGYGNYNGSTSNTSWVTNQVAFSTTGFTSFTTYAAPWSPRAQQRAVVDTDNYVGVYNLPLSGSGTQYSSVPSQAYYYYYNEVWYSTNAASTSATWVQLSVSGLGSAGYPGSPFAGNPTSNLNSAFYSNGADFNPCFGIQGTGSNKQLILYTGLYAGYRQNNQVPLATSYPGVYVGTLNLNSSSGGATAVGASVATVLLTSIVAVASQLL